MPTNTQVRISQKITDEAERSRLFKVLRPLSEQSTMGAIARTQSEGVPANLLAEDLLHLGELWRHLQQQLQSAKAPAEVFQELPIQTRLVRDLAGPNTVTIYVNDTDIFQRCRAISVSMPRIWSNDCASTRSVNRFLLDTILNVKSLTLYCLVCP